MFMLIQEGEEQEDSPLRRRIKSMFITKAGLFGKQNKGGLSVSRGHEGERKISMIGLGPIKEKKR